MSSGFFAGRNLLWWIYGVYLVLMFVAGSYGILAQRPIFTIGVFAIVFDVFAMIGFYGFLLRKSIASLLFWQVFALFYPAKFISSLGLLIYVAIHFPWHRTAADYTMVWALVGAVLTMPMIYALYIYAFRSPAIWPAKKAAADNQSVG